MGGNRCRATRKKPILDKFLLPADQLHTKDIKTAVVAGVMSSVRCSNQSQWPQMNRITLGVLGHHPARRTTDRNVGLPTSKRGDRTIGGRTDPNARGSAARRCHLGTGRRTDRTTVMYGRLKVSGQTSGTDRSGNTNVPTVWKLLESHAKRFGLLCSLL